MLYEYLKGLNIHSNLKLHELQELIAEHFYYEEERGKLFLKSDLNTVISIPDFKILLSKVDVTVSESYYSSALSSEKIDRLRWIDLATKRLPKWDSKPRIEQLSNHFILVDEQQRELFNKVFRFWIIKAAEMIANPSDEIAVNRLVFCVQSDKQGVGKTTFGRMLTAPFNEGVVPAVYEMDRPDFGKDAMIQLTTNTLVILDDINNWHSGKLKQLKSVISSKNIKVRPPYGAMTVSRPRTASFFATTNELGFLNEENDTRWAVFRISDIDKAYNNIDLSQVWSEAFHYAQD
jgi:predicted P-loop ATPase